MSHFTVLVIGEDPEGQLEPFSEHLQVEAYFEPMSSDDDTQMATHYKVKPTLEALQPHAVDWNGCELVEQDGGIGYMSTYNPDSKWDWYKLGGRWNNFFPLKEGAEGTQGESGINDTEAKEGRCDQAEYKDIDWETLFIENGTGKGEEPQPLTFAFLKDGEWVERGQMGWFATVSDEKADGEWNAQYLEMLKSLAPDTLISVYDCHI